MHRRSIPMFALVAWLSSLGAASNVHAHIKLKKPESWLKESDIGAPQKGGPCGPGGGDDIEPMPLSAAINTFEVGETIALEWTETVAHPGHFRVAFAEDRNDLKDPDLQIDGSCNYDESKLPTGAHGNVLADGLFLRSRTGPRDEANKTFTTQVTLPDKPCEKCTLQLIQFMENHPPACIYYHCADIRLVPKGSAPEAGSGGQAAAGAAGRASNAGAGSVAGGSAAGPAANSGKASSDDGGCSVQSVRAAQSSSALVLFTTACMLLWRRRRAP